MQEWMSPDPEDLKRLVDNPDNATAEDVLRLVKIAKAASWGVRMARHFNPAQPNPGFPGRAWDQLCAHLDGVELPKDDIEKMFDKAHKRGA